MKRLIQLTLLLFMLSILPGRAVSAEETPPAFHIALPLVIRQPPFTITHISPLIARSLGVVQDPFNANMLYTYTFNSGIYKSIDYGQTWFPSSKGLGYLVIQSLTADPLSPGVLYAGTYGDVNAAYNGVYKSVDYGATWLATGEMGNTWNGTYYKNPVVYVVAVDQNNPNILYAGTRMKLPDNQLGGGGVFRSDNAGGSWTAYNSGLPNDKLYVYDLVLNPNQPGQVFVTLHGYQPGGIYISNNSGGSWTQFFGISSALDGRALLLDPFNSAILFYGADTNAGIWRYEYNQQGGLWKQVVESMYVNVRALSADPYHQGRVYAGIRKVVNSQRRLLRSNDGGSTWLEIDAGDTSYPLAFSPDQQTVYMAIDREGIVRSADQGLSWQPSSNGLTGYSVTGLAAAANDPNYLAAALYGEGVKVSSDGGERWDDRMTGLDSTDLTFLAMAPGNKAVMFVSSDQSGVYRSRDAGLHWTELTAGYPTAAASLSAAGDELISPYANRPIPIPDEDLPPADTQPDNRPLALFGLARGNTLAVSPFDERVVLVGTSGRGIYRLVNDVWTPSGQASGTAYSLWFDQSLSGRVLAGVSAGAGGVLASANNGQTWSASSAGLAGRAVYSLAQSPFNASLFLAGTDSGVYASSDSGATWAQAGLPGQVVKSVTVYNSTVGVLYIAASEQAAYASANLPGSWFSISPALNDLGIQYLLSAPGGESMFVTSRLGGIKRVR